jgi:hypothetical protein
MWVTGWVRDRVSGREAAMGATIFVGLARRKWWGPVVLDAAPKPASHWPICERAPSNSRVGKRRPAPQTPFLLILVLPFSSAEGTNGQQKGTPYGQVQNQRA